MPVKTLLEEDWEYYDNRKIRDNRDGRYFACTEQWEVDYLKNMIKRNFPNSSEDDILTAIKACCETVDSPRPRKTFIECVVKKLQLA